MTIAASISRCRDSLSVPMRGVAILAILFSWSIALHAQAMSGTPGHSPELQPILDYISSSWSVLKRSTTTCEGIADPKLTEAVRLYLPADLAMPAGLRKLSQECNVRVEMLPRVIDGAGSSTTRLTLPGKSVCRPWRTIQ